MSIEDLPETKDEVMEEVRRIKDALAASFGYDVRRIVADAMIKQYECGHEVIPLPVRQR